MFQPVTSQVNFPKIEEGILALWKKINAFKRSVDNRAGNPLFMLYEGPPTANGKPGIHHVLTRVFKDIIPRYKAMKGYYTPRIAGWDTHGLPVELEVEKQLGISSKPEIEQYGIDKFNARCRQSVFSYLKEWETLTERIGYWTDLENAYITMRNEYIETVWWTIKQLWDRKLIYQGYRVTPHCPRCGTSLSSHEVALGYRDDVEDPSVYIKFKIDLSSLKGNEIRNRLYELFSSSGKPAYLLAWTTTPWTLPGNTALAVADDAEYAVVETEQEYIIMASALLTTIRLDTYKLVAKMAGKELVNVKYQPLFNPHEYGVERQRPQSSDKESSSKAFKAQKPEKDLTYKVIATDFVSMDEGTGIVHIAPAFGEVDFETGMENKLDFVQPVDLQGIITGNYPFSGKFVKEADSLIINNLKERGLLLRSETIRHTYPFCWRCESPLIYYAKQTWYIQTTTVKENLINNNEKINWYPDYIKHGRFGDWLENNVDWAFSRERYWGTPLPVWRCEECSHHECIGSFTELSNKPGFSGFKEPLDLHRPFVDELTFICPQCGSKMKRLPEVIDCWFDSGAMPIAQWHYPFENKTMIKDGRFPADYICEAVDQTRGWFYSLHAIATLLFNSTAYRNVICLGHILDAKGEKMSKAKGNVVQPAKVIDKYGADALRWYFFTSTPPGNVRRFSADLVEEVMRRVLSTLWNVYSFFVIYANIDKFTPGSEKASLCESELDQWIISELNQLIIDVDKELANYNPTDAGRKIESFIDALSNWYVRRSRRRFWKSESDADKQSAYETLYECLVTLAKIMAPFTPFLSEEMYQNLVRSVFPNSPDSVHLTDFPVADKSRIYEQLSQDIRLVMKIASLGRAARSQAGIKVRQPLPKVLVKVRSNREKEGLQRLQQQVLDELNVKTLEFMDTPTPTGTGYEITSEGDYAVAVPKEIPAELAKEGMAREIVHRVQMMRRSAGFDIADHVTTYYQGDDYIKEVMTDFTDYIKQETLSQQITEGPAEDGFSQKHKLAGHEILLEVKKAD